MWLEQSACKDSGRCAWDFSVDESWILWMSEQDVRELRIWVWVRAMVCNDQFRPLAPHPRPSSQSISGYISWEEIQITQNWGSVLLSSSVQSLSCFWLLATSWTAACPASLSNTNSWGLLRLMSIMSVMPSNHLILCHPLFLLPSIFPSIRVFSNESVLHIMWPKYWSFSFSISPSDTYSGLITFRMDWLDLLAVHRTLKSLPQHHSWKASVFCAQLSL